MSLISKLLAASLLMAAPSFTNAAVVTLDFEGIGNLQPVGDFYLASQGVSFSQDTLALIDADAGGSGNFANEPSPNTVMFFLNANNAVLNYAAGFTTGFSFFYSSSVDTFVTVYDGLNKTGSVLGTLTLVGNGLSGAGDPSGDFATWVAVGVAFSGIAKSIDFGGTANQTGFDNITFGSTTPGGGGPSPVPLPATAPLLIGALAGLRALRRRAA